MKKVLIIVFALVMVLSLAACNTKNDQNTQDLDENMIDNDDLDDDADDMGHSGDVNDDNDDTDDDMAHDDDLDSAVFTGKVSAVDGRTIIVAPDDGEDIRSSGDRVEVSLSSDHNFTVGDKVRVTYDGSIMQSDPVRVNAVNIEEID